MKREIELWEKWMELAQEDPAVKRELEEISGKENEIYDRFYRELEFGTGGLRGVLGAGTNRMNIYTVAKATQGYADYLKAESTSPVVAIAYDSRINSERFARVSAEVFAANGIKVWIYHELMPTPALSYAVRKLSCSGGIVITASHNPSKYNGYKVYGSDGGQITSDTASAILKRINRVDIFNGVRRIPFEKGLEDGVIAYISEDVISSYISQISSLALCREPIDKSVSIIYTPLNGAGLHCVTRVLRDNGFTNVTVVKEQEMPDGTFPTCPYPNPEIKEAMALGIEYAKRMQSDLLLATDPDCDRVGIAVRNGENYELLNGNEVGILLLDYICKMRLKYRNMPEKPVVVKTIVTTDLAKKIAAAYGVEVIEVLTGFKYIGEQIGLLEQRGEEDRFLLGFEESYGYLTGTFVRDKDAVNGALVICEMFAYYKSQGTDILEVLKELYQAYGYNLTTLHSYQFEGEQGHQKMQKFMEMMRNQTPKELGGLKITTVEDYQKQVRIHAEGKAEKITGLPQSNVLKFLLGEGSYCVIRPSGTEPKLKLYVSISGTDREDALETEHSVTEKIEEWLDADLN